LCTAGDFSALVLSDGGIRTVLNWLEELKQKVPTGEK